MTPSLPTKCTAAIIFANSLDAFAKSATRAFSAEWLFAASKDILATLGFDVCRPAAAPSADEPTVRWA